MDEQTTAAHNSVLVVVFDGLRPDYITPERMPNLHGFGQHGVVVERHHSVYPTVTRVNSPSIATGSTPGRHGLLHNTIHIPQVSEESFSSGSLEMLLKTDKVTGGKLLTTKSLGETMQTEGKKLWVTGSGGNGTLMMLNHQLTGHGVAGARGFIAPEPMETLVLDIMGKLAPTSTEPPYRERNQWAFEAFLKVGLDRLQPDAAIMWITDPDHTTHHAGVGAPLTLEAVRHVDELFGLMLEGIRVRGLEDRINIFVTTDHGFSTLTNELDPEAAVAEAGVDPEKYLVVPSRPKVYVKDRDPGVIRRIVKTLQQDETVGAIFTRSEKAGDSNGAVPGTLSLASVDYAHDRSPDILFDAAWNSNENEYGFAGHTTNSRYPANHGTSSPYDINIHLVAAGPDIKQRIKSRVPTGNIDLAPTICYLLGIAPPASMQGRVLHELLRNGPNPASVPFEEESFTAHVNLRKESMEYRAEVKKYRVGDTEYLRFTRAERNGIRQ